MSREVLTEMEFLRAGIREAIGEGAQLIADAITGKRSPDDGDNDLWLEFNHPAGLCGLCGNYGFVDTRGKVFSPAHVECGVLAYCICPNGRSMKKDDADCSDIAVRFDAMRASQALARGKK